ncbi:DUF2330 domain-containing protein [Pyxidicoccus caerfyrddinensis]|uniref:DUF2330 domain-containing protein n=1 Tax=Pyxidicoccus caerfyrddinensis TaxID=2709663 RepID=UPI0013D9F5C9|nr:DUF2330 domain-containing protein [Pyxidicoccus caerfyrddinensis]
MPSAARNLLRVAVSALALLAAPRSAHAFCGFYVAQADAKLFNQASQVVLVRDGERTVITMSNDFKGELTDFALVVPVPAVLERDQIHIGERKHLEHLDAYSSPRLVEYFDEDPCQEPVDYDGRMYKSAPTTAAAEKMSSARSKTLGVTVEAQYTVGEYDIVILSAKQSDGLETWLRESGYKVPARSSAALQPYIKQDMKFFVAKVNVKNQRAGGFQYLRPLQMAFESKKFMLPIRLGMANADGPQDLVIYTLTRKGRVESTNYRTVKVPSDVEIPGFVKGDFGAFYKALFEQAHEKAGRRALLTEYFWDMGWCDPCSADPLSPEELKGLGVFWRDGQSYETAFLTRLHVRYDSAHFPEDLVFQETADQQTFQGRYILRHAFQGQAQCSAAKGYWERVNERREREVQTLASLTGWSQATIRERMGKDAPKAKEPTWYQKLWK